MLDSDLARIYQVETRVFNQAVKRNANRFPSDFRFRLEMDEYRSLISQIVISNLSEASVRIICDKELYRIGASLKDLGAKCFGFTKMDAAEIRRIKAAAFSPS